MKVSKSAILLALLADTSSVKFVYKILIDVVHISQSLGNKVKSILSPKFANLYC